MLTEKDGQSGNMKGGSASTPGADRGKAGNTLKVLDVTVMCSIDVRNIILVGIIGGKSPEPPDGGDDGDGDGGGDGGEPSEREGGQAPCAVPAPAKGVG